MAKILSAFRADTAQNMQLDAGIFVANLTDPATFDGTIPEDAINLGATTGDNSFTYTPEYRNILEDVNGAKGLYKGAQVIDTITAEMTGSMKEVTAQNIKIALGAADITEASSSDKFDKINPRLNVKDEDYLKNLCWIGSINNEGELIIIEMKNVLNTSGFTFTATDKGSGSVEFTFVPHFDLSNPTEIPVTIYRSKKGEE